MISHLFIWTAILGTSTTGGDTCEQDRLAVVAQNIQDGGILGSHLVVSDGTSDIFHYVVISLCCYIAMSPCHYVPASLCRRLTLSPRHYFTLSPCHYVAASLCCLVTTLPCNYVAVSLCRCITMSLHHYAAASLCCPYDLSNVFRDF